MNTVESIELAKKLQKEYRDLEKMDREIRDKEAILDRPVQFYQEPERDTSLFLTGMRVVITIFLILAGLYIDALIMVGAFMRDWDSHSGNHQETAMKMIPLINIGIVILIIIIKYLRERSRKKYLKEQRVKQEEFTAQRRAAMREELAALREKRFEIREDLLKYEVQIPREFRTGHHMVKVKAMLQNGKAQNFDEAIGFLVQSAK